MQSNNLYIIIKAVSKGIKRLYIVANITTGEVLTFNKKQIISMIENGISFKNLIITSDNKFIIKTNPIKRVSKNSNKDKIYKAYEFINIIYNEICTYKQNKYISNKLNIVMYRANVDCVFDNELCSIDLVAYNELTNTIKVARLNCTIENGVIVIGITCKGINGLSTAVVNNDKHGYSELLSMLI